MVFLMLYIFISRHSRHCETPLGGLFLSYKDWVVPDRVKDVIYFSLDLSSLVCLCIRHFRCRDGGGGAQVDRWMMAAHPQRLIVIDGWKGRADSKASFLPFCGRGFVFFVPVEQRISWSASTG